MQCIVILIAPAQNAIALPALAAHAVDRDGEVGSSERRAMHTVAHRRWRQRRWRRAPLAGGLQRGQNMREPGCPAAAQQPHWLHWHDAA